MGGLDQCCGKLSEESLRSLGRIAVLGALLNQDNQLPLPIWRDSVNLAKITNVMMLENGTQSIVGVEQCTRPIKDVAMRKEYHDRVKAFVAELLQSTPKLETQGYIITQKAVMDDIVEVLSKSGFEVCEADAIAFLEGCRDCLKGIANAHNNGALKKALDEAASAATQGIRQDAEAITAADSSDFVLQTAAAIADAVGKGTMTKAMSVEAAGSASRPPAHGSQAEAENCCQKGCRMM